jgi:hypothetical protein
MNVGATVQTGIMMLRPKARGWSGDARGARPLEDQPKAVTGAYLSRTVSSRDMWFTSRCAGARSKARKVVMRVAILFNRQGE